MARFPSLPENSDLTDVFRRFPMGVKSLCEYTDNLLRGPSPFSVGDKRSSRAGCPRSQAPELLGYSAGGRSKK